MLTEIMEMPVTAKQFLNNSPAYSLPKAVAYIGMGSSYFAPLAFKYMGIPVYPELASEFYNYLHNGDKIPNGVLLSQSGRSTEVLWCSTLFQKYIAICNDINSALCHSEAVENIISLLAGEEKYSSSKTYINTLLALFKGFGIDAEYAINLMSNRMQAYEKTGSELATAVHETGREKKITGIYIIGSGPNISTALQAALILSESTKLTFTGMPMAQYDHGPKETAADSIVINIIAKGKSYDRSKKLSHTIKAAGAQVFEIEEPGVGEHESILNNIVPFNFMAYYLSEKLGVQDTFVVGGKVTEVNIS